MFSNWLSWAALLIACTSAFAAIRLGKLVNRARAMDHERSRRFEAVNMMKFWYDKTYSDIQMFRRMREVVDVLDNADCKSIEDSQILKVEHGAKTNALRSFFQHKDISAALPTAAADGTTEIPAEMIRTLRAEIVKYLNLLEIVAVGYRANVCHQEIIAEEFRNLLFRKNKFIFEKYLASVDRYPSLRRLGSDGKFMKNKQIEDFPQLD